MASVDTIQTIRDLTDDDREYIEGLLREGALPAAINREMPSIPTPVIRGVREAMRRRGEAVCHLARGAPIFDGWLSHARRARGRRRRSGSDFTPALGRGAPAVRRWSMTLVEAITNLTALVTQMAQAQQATGMTADQAALLQQVSADVAALKSSQQTVIGSLATHTEQLSGLAQQLAANSAADDAMRAVIGDTSQLGA